MPVYHDSNLPSVQSPNNSTIIRQNSACSLFAHVFRYLFVHVSLRVILFPKNSKLVQMHNLKKSFKYFIFQKEAPKKIIKRSLGWWTQNNDWKSKHLESSWKGHLKRGCEVGEAALCFSQRNHPGPGVFSVGCYNSAVVATMLGPLLVRYPWLVTGIAVLKCTTTVSEMAFSSDDWFI